MDAHTPSGLTIHLRRQHTDHQLGGDVRISSPRRWVRLAAYYGSAPGSNTGFWRTRAGDVRGWNYRIGSIRRCLTLLAHTRPGRADD